MGSFGNFLGGLLVGAAVGASAIIFAAPKSGGETRADLKSLWNGAIDTGKDVAKRREEELWADFNVRVKSKADVLNANSTTSTLTSSGPTSTPSGPTSTSSGSTTTSSGSTSTSSGVRTYTDPQ